MAAMQRVTETEGWVNRVSKRIETAPAQERQAHIFSTLTLGIIRGSGKSVSGSDMGTLPKAPARMTAGCRRQSGSCSGRAAGQ